MDSSGYVHRICDQITKHGGNVSLNERAFADVCQIVLDVYIEGHADGYQHGAQAEILPVWTCGCGIVNGVNLSTCRVCGRKEFNG